MLTKTINYFRSKSETLDKFNALIIHIEEIAKRSDVLNLCAEPTGYSWLGVKNAGLSLFPTNTAEIPQYYSNQLLSDTQLIELGKKIGSLKFKQLIFNGFNTYFLTIIDHVLVDHPTCRIGAIHHGFFAELSDNSTLSSIYSSLIEGIKTNRIHKIGFAKKGNSAVFKRLFDIEPFEIVNKNPKFEIQDEIACQQQIGVLTNSSFRKNTLTQVTAALCCTDYTVIVSEKNGAELFDSHNKLVELGHLDHAKFLAKIAQNTINSHVTFSEASGGQVFTESLALGVPCLTSLTHGYLDENAYLRDALVVDRFDDAWAIHEKMLELIDQRDSVSKVCLEHSEKMNDLASVLLKKYLEG